MKNELMKKELTSSKLIDFGKFGDERGTLIALEALVNIPFEIKRVYYIYDAKIDTPRGFHAHIYSEEVLICLNGSVDVILDDGRKKKTYELDTKDQGLFIKKMIWHELHNFSEDCVLISLASNYHDEGDYIRDYERFMKTKK